MELKRVVVTGLGAITPLGNTVESYWDGLVKVRVLPDPLLDLTPPISKLNLPAR